jgi:two-component system chemotaxis response regulator CheY
MHVLIADDEPGTRLLLAAALERLGHRCTQAADGHEALALYREHQPQVVITDWEMPGLDGTELARRVRAEPDIPYAYVVVLTGQADESAARAAMEAGADDLVVKPLDPAELERKLIAAERVTALHERLHRDARQDPLTGVGNRLRLAEDLEALCGRVVRYGHAYCVALFDVDRFKNFNDGAGHLAGDDVLRAVATALAETTRSGDTLYRYGGEEFLVLLPEQTLDGAALAAERLRAAVEALGLEHPDAGPVTVSAGVAGLGSSTCSPEQLFELADRALYRAKDGGRNRVEVESADESDGDREGRPIRLLVADDDAAVRLTLASLAKRDDGLELVGAAPDADQAIELAKLRRPDVVLLDFDMPGGGGVRAAIDIRELLPGVRIVALSADESASAQLDMSRAGAVGYLVKGAADDEIIRTIRSAYRW